MRKMRIAAIIMAVLFLSCGSENPMSNDPAPEPAPEPAPDPAPEPAPEPSPKSQGREYILASMAFDAGPTPFVLSPPHISGRLELLDSSKRYQMSFSIAVANLDWSKTIVGEYSVAGDTLLLSPDDSLKTSAQPRTQTLIVEATAGQIQAHQVQISIPIRPGAWREEDHMNLVYTRTVVAKRAAGLPSIVLQDQIKRVAPWIVGKRNIGR